MDEWKHESAGNEKNYIANHMQNTHFKKYTNLQLNFITETQRLAHHLILQVFLQITIDLFNIICNNSHASIRVAIHVSTDLKYFKGLV